VRSPSRPSMCSARSARCPRNGSRASAGSAKHDGSKRCASKPTPANSPAPLRQCPRRKRPPPSNAEPDLRRRRSDPPVPRSGPRLASTSCRTSGPFLRFRARRERCRSSRRRRRSTAASRDTADFRSLGSEQRSTDPPRPAWSSSVSSGAIERSEEAEPWPLPRLYLSREQMPRRWGAPSGRGPRVLGWLRRADE